jgi:hypothetical protein
MDIGSRGEFGYSESRQKIFFPRRPTCATPWGIKGYAQPALAVGHYRGFRHQPDCLQHHRCQIDLCGAVLPTSRDSHLSEEKFIIGFWFNLASPFSASSAVNDNFSHRREKMNITEILKKTAKRLPDKVAFYL